MIHGTTLCKTLPLFVSQFLYDGEAPVDSVESGELYFIPFLYWTFPHKISFGEMIPHEKPCLKKKITAQNSLWFLLAQTFPESKNVGAVLWVSTAIHSALLSTAGNGPRDAP